MSTANPLLTEFNRVGGPVRGTLASLSETWICPTLDNMGTPTDIVAGNLVAFVWQKKVWQRDSADTTSAHDGVTVFVTSDGIRFKSVGTNGAGLLYWPVIDFQNTPPGTAALGDSYGVGNAPTGSWSSNAKAIATCLVGGITAAQVWAFTPATPGLITFDKSQGFYRSYTTGLAWIDGLGAINTAASISPEALIVSRFSVQSQTATPPASPTAGQYWIVGAGATGAWVGKDQQIAKCTNATGPVWAFFPASTGWQAYNIATSHEMVYSGGIWSDLQRPRIVNYPVRLTRGSTIVGTGTSPGQATAPTNATGAIIFPEGTGNIPAYTLAKSTNRLLVKVRLDLTSAAADSCIAVYIDGQITCTVGNWACFGIGVLALSPEFEISVGDISPHQYNVFFYGGGTVQRAYLQFIEIET